MNYYSSLWKSCDELKGGIDAFQYKDYILTLSFVKYVSDKSKVDGDFLIINRHFNEEQEEINDLEAEVEELTSKVDEHLKRMGFA